MARFTIEGGRVKVPRAQRADYLTALVEAGEPLGLSTLAAATGESEQTIAQAIEPFLLRKGYIRKGPRGRIASAKAVELVNGKAA